MSDAHFSFPDTLRAFGFSSAKTGGHMARSVMLAEFQLLLAIPHLKTPGEFRRVIEEENALGKPTVSSRQKSFRHLVELYCLDASRALFRVLLRFSAINPDATPLLALVCVYCRDPQLRASFSLLEQTAPGTVIPRRLMEEHLETHFPERFSPAMKRSLAQNVNTTWTVSGHLHGRSTKTRTIPTPSFLATTYALFAGYLMGLRGDFLLQSVFSRLVAVSPPQAIEHLKEASKHGFLRLRHAGGVTEIDFSPLLNESELSSLHGTA